MCYINLHQVMRQITASRPLRFIYDPVGYCLSCGRTRQELKAAVKRGGWISAMNPQRAQSSREIPTQYGETWGNMGKHGEDAKVPSKPTMSTFVQWLDPQVWTWDITSGVFAHSRKLSGAKQKKFHHFSASLCFFALILPLDSFSLHFNQETYQTLISEKRVKYQHHRKKHTISETKLQGNKHTMGTSTTKHWGCLDCGRYRGSYRG